jgi:tRNA C32,U32 (ribose-2'-O)-methylase TrmJ
MWQNIRAAFLRMQPTEQEIRTLYGAIQAIKK